MWVRGRDTVLALLTKLSFFYKTISWCLSYPIPGSALFFPSERISSMKHAHRFLLGGALLVVLLSATFAVPGFTPKAQAASCYAGAFNLPQITLTARQFYSTAQHRLYKT